MGKNKFWPNGFKRYDHSSDKKPKECFLALVKPVDGFKCGDLIAVDLETGIADHATYADAFIPKIEFVNSKDLQERSYE